MKNLFLVLVLSTSAFAFAGQCPLWGDFSRPTLEQYPTEPGYLSWDASYEEALNLAQDIAHAKKLYGTDDAGKTCSIEFIKVSACHPMWGSAGRSLYKTGQTEQLMKLKVKVNYSSHQFVITGYDHKYSEMAVSGLLPILPIGRSYNIDMKTDENNDPTEFSFSRAGLVHEKSRVCKNLSSR